MRIWRWTIMRTAEWESERADIVANYAMRKNAEADLDLCREEKRVLTASLDRSKDAIAAVIEQREKLAAKLREAKR